MTTSEGAKPVLGWKEWVALPELGLPAIKAKVDTGARTSALHAYFIETFRQEGRQRLRFGIHPLQKNTRLEVVCESDLLDCRVVRDSGGHAEERFVIRTPVQVGEDRWPIEMTLTNRDSMLFRMLLGRQAIRNRFFVDSGAAYLSGRVRRPRAIYEKLGKK